MSLRLPPPRPPVRMDISMAVVNIVLLLIFFFVVTGQDPAPETGVEPPRSALLPSARLPSPLLVIDGRGWMLDGMPITPELLPVALDQAGAADRLYLMIDRSASASRLIAALNRPELARREIRLVTRPDEDGP